MENTFHPDRLRAYQSIPEAFFSLASEDPSKEVYRLPTITSGNYNWGNFSYGETEARIRKISAFLERLNLSHGTRCAILSNTRAEWMESDIAIQSVGGVSVSVYHSLLAHEVGYILFDSESEVVFAENEEQVKKIISCISHEIQIPETEAYPSQKTSITIKAIICFEECFEHPLVTELSAIIQGFGPSSSLECYYKKTNRDSLSSLVYTSGTTGPAKGVMQTHGNHLSNVEQAMRSKMFAPEGNLFLFLPLAHSFAKLIGYIGFLTPASLIFPSIASRKSSIVDLVRVAQDIKTAGAMVLPTVPRLFEKIQGKVVLESQEKSISGKILSLTLSSAHRMLMVRCSSTRAPLSLTLLYYLTSPVRKKIKKMIFGDNFLHAISGGAKLPIETNNFFEMLGISVYEGYGLTETVVATNVNRADQKKIGSVGPCLDGVEVKIAPDGEILFRGPNISPGYYRRPKATKECFGEDGWFATGDIGHLEGDFLFITDRKKDIIVTAGGKKIPPLPIESELKQSPLISQAVVLGDGKPFCAALITIESPSTHGLVPPYNSNTELRAKIQTVIDSINATKPSYESIKKFYILDEDFSIENGTLTPTLKIKRKVVSQKFASEISSMF